MSKIRSACDATGDKETQTIKPRKTDRTHASVIFVVYPAMENNVVEKHYPAKSQ